MRKTMDNRQGTMDNSELPKGWEIKKLGDVCEVQRGLTYSGKDAVDFSNNIVLRATNINLKNCSLDFSELKYLRNDFSIQEKYKLKKGSLLICFSSGSKSHLGKVALVDKDYEYSFGGFIGQINPDNKILSKYLFFSLISENYKIYISELTDGININNLKIKDLQQYQIPLPPLPEQKCIVSILDRAFEAIDKAKANAEQNLKNAKELFESYLQGVFENKGDDWEEKTLKEVGIVQTGTTPPTKDKSNYGNYIPFAKPAHFKPNGSIETGESMLSEQGLKKGRLFEKNSILMVCIGATIGKTGFSSKSISSNQQINSLTPNNNYYARFFYYAFISSSFQKQVLTQGKSAQATLPIINKTKWENLKVIFPKSISEQQQIVQKLDSLSTETKKLESIYQQKIDDLEELKKSILQKAFNGKL